MQLAGNPGAKLGHFGQSTGLQTRLAQRRADLRTHAAWVAAPATLFMLLTLDSHVSFYRGFTSAMRRLLAKVSAFAEGDLTATRKAWAGTNWPAWVRGSRE